MIILMDMEAATECEPDKSIVRPFFCIFLCSGATKIMSSSILQKKKLLKTYDKFTFQL